MSKLLFIDTETTGLPLPLGAELHRQPKIIEIGGVLFDTETDRIEESFGQFIDPGEAISEEISEITGITNEDLKGQPTFGQYLTHLVDWFEKADVLIAHNAEFDVNMIRIENHRLIESGEVNIDVPFPKKIICTVKEFSLIMGYDPRLSAAYEHFTGEKLDQKHRALDDAHALAKTAQASGIVAML